MFFKRNLSIAVLINIYFMAMCLTFCHLRYGSIDDYFMAGILSGMYGEEYNIHLFFVNAIYGCLLLPLYHLFPQISWYYIGEIASIFISLTIITYILINKMGRSWGCILGILMIATYAKDLYVVLQFTQCSAILSVTGMVVLIEVFEQLRSNQSIKVVYVLLLIGVLCLWWGSFMRWEVFLMGVPFLATALLLCVRRFWKIRVHVILILLLVYAGALAFHSFDRSLYQTPEYKKFVNFQPFRVLLGDGAFYNEQAVYEDMQEMGLQPEDFNMLRNWVFYDNEVFAPDSVQPIVQLINRYTIRPHLKSIPVLLLQNFSPMAKTPVFVLWLLFGFILLISNKQKFIFYWIALAIIAAVLSYFIYINRVVYRVEFGLWLYATLLTIVFWKKLPNISPKITFGSVAVLLAISSVVYFYNRDVFRSPNTAGIVSVKTMQQIKGYDCLSAYINSKSDSIIFVMPSVTYELFSEHRLPPYLTEPIGSWQQIISIGFWTPYYPDVEKAFRKRGMTNPIKDLVNDNVYYVSDSKYGVSLVDFLENHHYERVHVDTIEIFDDIMVLKYAIDDKLTLENK